MNLENIPPPTKETITGLILAGGKGRRFNCQDKGLLAYKNTTLVEHAITRLQPQTAAIIISSNRHFAFYQQRNINYVEDKITGFSGPLAGIHAALAVIKTDWLVSIACDTPCFPYTYVEQLINALDKKKTLIAVAHSNKRLQNVSMLLHKSLYKSLDSFLMAGERKAQIWLEQHAPAICEFNSPPYAFFNINTPDELTEIERLNCDK